MTFKRRYRRGAGSSAEASKATARVLVQDVVDVLESLLEHCSCLPGNFQGGILDDLLGSSAAFSALLLAGHHGADSWPVAIVATLTPIEILQIAGPMSS